MNWREMTTSERQLSWVWGGLVLACVALVPLWTTVAPLLRRCVFRDITGIPCPSCGSTRGVLAILDGRFTDAFTLNPLIAAVVVMFLVGGMMAPAWARLSGKVPRLPIPIPVWLRVGIVSVILSNWVWVIVAH